MAVVALVLMVGLVARNLYGGDWNPSIFIAVGADDEASRQYAVDLLGPNIDFRLGTGHDGRFFFAQANDPLLLEPDVHASVLDRPIYRSQRVLFPLIAGGFGLLPPWGVVWGMLILGVLSVAAGTYATSLVAIGMGASPWWGLAFGLNVGVISELMVGGAGHLGFGLVMFSVAALQRGKLWASVTAVTAAVLAREVLLISALGLVLWLWQRSKRDAALWHLLLPPLAVAAWGVYVRARLGWVTGASEVQEVGLPLVGFFRAAEFWPEHPMNMIVGVTIIVLMALFARRLVSSNWLVGFVAAGFVPLGLLLTRQVWFSYYDITRAVAPVLTAFLLMAFAVGRRDYAASIEARA